MNFATNDQPYPEDDRHEDDSEIIIQKSKIKKTMK